MSISGVLRTLNAAANRAERENRRRQKEYQRLAKDRAKLQEQERALLEVEEYENYIELIQSIHKDVGNDINWSTILKTPSPKDPIKEIKHEAIAINTNNNYKPSLTDRLFNKTEKKKKILKENIESAKAQDNKIHNKNIQKFNQDLKDWENALNLAKSILEGEEKAYLLAIKEMGSFEEIEQLGSELKIDFINKEFLRVNFQVYENRIIPKEIKILLKSGKLSTKNMPQGQFNEIYQDYVCSAVLRIARELFGLLPINKSIINANGAIINSKTGHQENVPILSVFINKDALEKINFDYIDPSDSMENFDCNMKFKKTKGLDPVEELEISNFI